MIGNMHHVKFSRTHKKAKTWDVELDGEHAGIVRRNAFKDWELGLSVKLVWCYSAMIHNAFSMWRRTLVDYMGDPTTVTISIEIKPEGKKS